VLCVLCGFTGGPSVSFFFFFFACTYWPLFYFYNLKYRIALNVTWDVVTLVLYFCSHTLCRFPATASTSSAKSLQPTQVHQLTPITLAKFSSPPKTGFLVLCAAWWLHFGLFPCQAHLGIGVSEFFWILDETGLRNLLAGSGGGDSSVGLG